MAARTERKTGRVCVGQVGAPHGVRGLMTVRPFTDAPEGVAAYGPVETETGRVLELTVKSAKKGVLVVAVKGVGDREAAAALKGQHLYVGRDRLPPAEEDEWYHADLVGLAAEGENGQPLGRVVAVHDFGAGDMLEVDPGDRATVFVPFSRAAVPVVDVAGGRLVIHDPEIYFEAGGEATGEDR